MTEDDAIAAKLKDLPPRVKFFVESFLDVIKDFALLYSGTPDETALLHLEGYLSRIEPGLIEEMGADRATILLDALHRAVMTRKHEIEAGGASRA